MSDNIIFEYDDHEGAEINLELEGDCIRLILYNGDECPTRNTIYLANDEASAISEAFIRTLDQDQKKALFRKFGYIWDASGWMGENQ